MSSLRDKARAFADAWAPAPRATDADVAAARAAGYSGDDETLRRQGARLRRDERVRRRIEARLGRPLDELLAEARVAATVGTSSQTSTGLTKGVGRGTPTERIELLMGMGRSKKAAIRDRVAAIRLAAELEGELRSNIGRPAAITIADPPPAAPPSPSPPRLALVTNALDAERV